MEYKAKTLLLMQVTAVVDLVDHHYLVEEVKVVHQVKVVMEPEVGEVTLRLVMEPEEAVVAKVVSEVAVKAEDMEAMVECAFIIKPSAYK